MTAMKQKHQRQLIQNQRDLQRLQKKREAEAAMAAANGSTPLPPSPSDSSTA